MEETIIRFNHSNYKSIAKQNKETSLLELLKDQKGEEGRNIRSKLSGLATKTLYSNQFFTQKMSLSERQGVIYCGNLDLSSSNYFI